VAVQHAVPIPVTGAGAAQTADEALVEAARADPRAFPALYVRHCASAYRSLRGRLGSDDEAADLTATTSSDASGEWLVVVVDLVGMTERIAGPWELRFSVP
jgi:hypothetical protein